MNTDTTGRPDPRQSNPVWRGLHPRTVADLVEIHHQSDRRLRLALRRDDPPAVEAICAALRQTGAQVERAPGPFLVISFDRGDMNPADALASPLPSLPFPPSRVSTGITTGTARATVWQKLTAGSGPPWEPPAIVQVTPRAGEPPAWDINLVLGVWTLPHRMDVTETVPLSALELSITGKLNAVVRYTLSEQPSGCRVQQDLWFAVTGLPVEAAVGGVVVETMARRHAPEHLRALLGE